MEQFLTLFREFGAWGVLLAIALKSPAILRELNNLLDRVVAHVKLAYDSTLAVVGSQLSVTNKNMCDMVEELKILTTQMAAIKEHIREPTENAPRHVLLPE